MWEWAGSGTESMRMWPNTRASGGFFGWISVVGVLHDEGPDSHKSSLALHTVYGNSYTRMRPRTFAAPRWMAKGCEHVGLDVCGRFMARPLEMP